MKNWWGTDKRPAASAAGTGEKQITSVPSDKMSIPACASTDGFSRLRSEIAEVGHQIKDDLGLEQSKIPI
jgi:hypothetical protein